MLFLFRVYTLSQAGHEGLLCVFKQRLFEVETQYFSARLTYRKALGQTAPFDDFSENEEGSSSTDDEDSE